MNPAIPKMLVNPVVTKILLQAGEAILVKALVSMDNANRPKYKNNKDSFKMPLKSAKKQYNLAVELIALAIAYKDIRKLQLEKTYV